jgi:hypothetical protein
MDRGLADLYHHTVPNASLFRIATMKSIWKAGAGRGGTAVIFMVIDGNHC